MSEGFVRCKLFESFAILTFDRREYRNAMTWKMYQELYDHCLLLNKNRSIRCVILRGAGGEAFVSGTDIKQFQAFSTGQDGIEYERRSEEIISAVETLHAPIDMQRVEAMVPVTPDTLWQAPRPEQTAPLPRLDCF
jgi:enoyl-CoA hydratase/carnithine racemase